MSAVADDLTFLRRMRKIVAEEGGIRPFSRKTLVEPSTMHRIASGQGYPGFVVLQKLGRAGIDLNYLILGRRK
jgi:hypothetical protein